MAAPCPEASEIKSVLTKVISELDFITEVKQEQEYALSEFLSGKDVFAVLPTGFGKSLIYQLAPLVLKKMYPSYNESHLHRYIPADRVDGGPDTRGI